MRQIFDTVELIGGPCDGLEVQVPRGSREVVIPHANLKAGHWETPPAFGQYIYGRRRDGSWQYGESDLPKPPPKVLPPCPPISPPPPPKRQGAGR